jgi:hypothetical protein
MNIYTQGKVKLDFKKDNKNSLLTGSKGYFGLTVDLDVNHRTCHKTHAKQGYTVRTLTGTVVAKVAFMRDAKTLITILEGHTYSKEGVTWNKSKIGYIHLKDISMFSKGLIKEVRELLPNQTKVLSGRPKGRVRTVKKAYKDTK